MDVNKVIDPQFFMQTNCRIFTMVKYRMDVNFGP